MTFTVVRRTNDIDVETLIDGARSALIANSTLLPLLKLPADDPSLARIFPEVAEEEDLSTTPGKQRAALSFITLTLPSVVTNDYYNQPNINALMDVGVYKTGWATATVRNVVKESLRSLVVLPWTATGFTILSSSMGGPGTGFRPASQMVGGKMVRGRQYTFRIIAQKS